MYYRKPRTEETTTTTTTSQLMSMSRINESIENQREQFTEKEKKNID